MPGTAGRYSVDVGVHLYSARMAARALPLGLGLLVLLGIRAYRMLAALLVLVAAIEVGDCVSALANRDWPQPSGAVIVVAFRWAAARLTGAPFWSVRAWRDPVPFVRKHCRNAC